MANKTRASYTFTATGVSPTVAVKDNAPLAYWGLQVDVDPTITDWTVELTGSLSGVGFRKMLRHKSGVFNDDEVVWGTNAFPVDYVRFECTQLVGVGNARCYWVAQT